MNILMGFEYKNIEIASSAKTPHVILNKDTGEILIEGRSFPENTPEFYYQFTRWLAEYSLSPAPKTKVNLGLLYLNSSSVSIITGMMKLLDNMISMKTEIEIKWSFETGDEDMKDLGLYYQESLRCSVQVIEVTKLDF
jgi:hypothetical protein